MKKLLALLLTLIMLLPALAAAEEPVIIDKIKNPDDPFTFPEDAKLLEIYIPKIYDSDSFFIRYGDYTMLLDCAGECWESVRDLMHMLEIKELTYAFASHPHTDHIGGFQHLLKEIKAGSFIHAFPEDYPYANKPAYKVYDELHSQGVPFRRVGQGDAIDFGDVQMTVYQKWDDELSGNNLSAVLKVEYGERAMLFTADIQMDTQRAFAADNAPFKADILKMPHHGYNNTQQVFLDLVQPELAIFTSAPNAANGVQGIKNNNIPYYYTYYGVLRLLTDGKVWTLERLK